MNTLQALNVSGSLVNLMFATMNLAFRAARGRATRRVIIGLLQLAVNRKSKSVNGKRSTFESAV